jgi:deferrochelatase/peroxidase EfeB
MADSVMRASPEFGDIQGIVRYGHRRLTAACFVLLRIADAAAARSWLAQAPVTDAAQQDPPPETALQVALTAEGLGTLGVPASIVGGFSAEFIAGMTGDENRSRRLGDVGANDPALWRWGNSGAAPHVLAMIYATPARFDAWRSEIAGDAWTRAFSIVGSLTSNDLGGYEPFGFADGISQPAIDWEQSVDLSGMQLEYRNLSALGEFVLGYPNEYGKYTDRPILDPAADPSDLLPAAEDTPAQRDLGRNGTYLVLRDLSQDVSGFWQFLDRQSSETGQTARALAEAMVGRTIAGQPLVPLIQRPIAGIDERSVRRTGLPLPMTRRARAVRSARIYAAPTPAMQTCRVGPAARFRDLSALPVSTGRACATISSRRPVFIACCAAAALMGPTSRSRRRCGRPVMAPNAVSALFASTPASRGSLNSCKTPGWPAQNSMACSRKATRCWATASRRLGAKPPKRSLIRAAERFAGVCAVCHSS